MRLTIVGGGGFRVPLVFRALLRSQIKIRTIRLYDVDAARLAAIAHVLAQQAAGAGAASGAGGVPEIVPTSDLDSALRGADAVFCATRVGGVRGRVLDERVALAHGVLGQETVGAGGIAYGLRTVPVAVELARRIAVLAPAAWTVNFTNPAGLVTEAMAAELGPRVIGICDSPAALAGRIARALSVPPGALRVDYVGLNHLGWVRRALVGGVDRLPALLADDAALASFEEGRLFGADELRRQGAVPNEYLHYQQERFYADVAADPGRALAGWEATLLDRERTYLDDARGTTAGTGGRDTADIAAGGYENVAVPLLAALAGAAGSTTQILDVPNAGAVPGLPDDAVVEVPCLVDTNGAAPLAAGPVEPERLDLLRRVKDVERLTIRAALTGSRELARQAFAAHPLVGPDVADPLLDAYLAASPELRAVLRS